MVDFFKEYIRLVISLPFALSCIPKDRCPLHTIQPLSSPSSSNPRFLYVINLHFLLWFLGSSLILGLWGGPLFSCELSYTFKQVFLIQNFWTFLHGEGFLGYLVYNIASKESLPYFLHLRLLLYIYSFLPLSCLQEMLLLTLDRILSNVIYHYILFCSYL